jgi:phage-related baseplate assembly protein
MISQLARLALLVAAIAFSSSAFMFAHAEGKDLAALAAALKDTKVTLGDGLKASEREGKPVSAKFEIDDGKLQLSVYTMKPDGFAEVVIDPKTGAIAKAEKITDAEDLEAAATQKAAMEKATISLLAATQKAVMANAGYQAVSVVPEMKEGHPAGEVTLLQGETVKKVAEKLD